MKETVLTPKKLPQILVVDDQPINIKLLQRKLERENYVVHTATTGVECLESVRRQRPDLILLDVMMPEMDGIETCQRLKDNEETGDIPIIFITAKSSKEGKLEGLGAGAIDYITKPIDLDETLARVKTQLRIQEIYRQNIDLQRRLGEARRAAAVGAITQGIAHNLNNLLGVVVGYLDLLKSGFDSPDMVQRSVGLMDQAITRMVTIISHLSSIATNERVALTQHRLEDLLRNSVQRFRTEHKVNPPLDLKIETPQGFMIDANTEVFENIMVKLIINAYEAYARATPEEERSIVVVARQSVNRMGDDCVRIEVHDRGTGIDEKVADTLFEPFISTKTSVGRGMGLTMARHAMRNISGELELSNREDGGATAIINYPLQPSHPEQEEELPVAGQSFQG